MHGLLVLLIPWPPSYLNVVIIDYAGTLIHELESLSLVHRVKRCEQSD